MRPSPSSTIRRRGARRCARVTVRHDPAVRDSVNARPPADQDEFSQKLTSASGRGRVSSARRVRQRIRTSFPRNSRPPADQDEFSQKLTSAGESEDEIPETWANLWVRPGFSGNAGKSVGMGVFFGKRRQIRGYGRVFRETPTNLWIRPGFSGNAGKSVGMGVFFGKRLLSRGYGRVFRETSAEPLRIDERLTERMRRCWSCTAGGECPRNPRRDDATSSSIKVSQCSCSAGERRARRSSRMKSRSSRERERLAASKAARGCPSRRSRSTKRRIPSSRWATNESRPPVIATMRLAASSCLSASVRALNAAGRRPRDSKASARPTDARQ